MQSDAPLEDGLELAFNHFARKPYEILRNTPHGGEMMESLEDAASEEMAESKRRFTEAMKMLIKPHMTDGSNPHLTADSLSDFIVHTAMGHKAKATSAEHLESLLATLKAVTLKSLA